MTYLFKSRATGDVLMMQPTGEMLLRIIGKTPTATGIIEPDELPSAIAALEAALDEEAVREPKTGPLTEQAPDTWRDEAVSLRQRAWPLLEMMRSSSAAGQEIVWGE